MERELEIAGAASAGGWMRWRKHAHLPLGTPCPNCATPLAGPYCHACGQLGEQFNRSLAHLIWEAFENFFHVDGRLVQTLPQLVLRPQKLTTDYIEGRRASQIPPLRLFLVVMLVFFFVGGLRSHRDTLNVVSSGAGSKGAASRQGVNFNIVGSRASSREAAFSQGIKARMPKAAGPGKSDDAVGAWLRPRLTYAADHPREFTMVFQSWTHRIAIGMLPIAAAILSLLFVLKRRFYVFDHLIFSMHSLSFMGLLASLQNIVGLVPGLHGPSALLLLAAPVHLFVHMRGVYGIGVFGALWRMFVLFVLSAAALGAMMLGGLLIGLNEMDTASAAKAAQAPASSYLKVD